MGSSLNYKHLFDLAPFGMVLVSLDGNIHESNVSFQELLGYQSDELHNMNYESLIFREATDFNKDNKTSVPGNDFKELCRVKYKQKGGGIIEVYHKNTIIKCEDENTFSIIQIVEILNDVQVEEVLKQESGLFDALINSFPNEIFIKNRESQFIMVNKANLEKLNQPSVESIIGKTDFDFFGIKHAQKAFYDEQQIISTGKPIINFEEKEIFPDGRTTYINTSKMPLINKRGEIIGTFGISQDITESKIHELQLKEQNSILQAITSKMPVVIFKYIKGKGLTSLIGTSDLKRAFEASRMAKLKIADSLNHFVDKISSQKNKQGFFSFSTTSHINKKERFFENFIFKGYTETDEYIGLALDYTERKLTEQKLKRDARDLEKVNKELNQFAYIISHDLKAPLRAITKLSEWIQEDLVDYDNPEVKEQLNLLRGRVERMENLINGILSYSRLTRAQLVIEKIDVANLIDEVSDFLMINSSYKIIKTSNFPLINFSKIHLEQIFMNLISNCIKHHDKDSGIIIISYKEIDGMHEFMVGDDGPGIALEYHQKVFQIFQTLKARDAFESTGIGLTIVQKIIETQGGTVRIDSAEGGGCKVYFTLPKIK